MFIMNIKPDTMHTIAAYLYVMYMYYGVYILQ